MLFRSGSRGFFGRGVNIAMDPRTLGTQIDDSIMQQNLLARLVLTDKKHFLKISVRVLDGRIFLTGKVDDPEEKLQITKLAWETKGARSVKNPRNRGGSPSGVKEPPIFATRKMKNTIT